MPVIAGSIDWPLSVGVPVTTPLVVGLATGFTVGDEMEKAGSNSRRAKAASVHSAGVWAGASGAVVTAKGLRTLTMLATIPATMVTGVVTAAVVVVTVAGCGQSLTSAARSIVAAVGTDVVAAAATMGVVAVGVCAA